jgi:hypothetical protein
MKKALAMVVVVALVWWLLAAGGWRALHCALRHYTHVEDLEIALLFVLLAIGALLLIAWSGFSRRKTSVPLLCLVAVGALIFTLFFRREPVPMPMTGDLHDPLTVHVGFPFHHGVLDSFPYVWVMSAKYLALDAILGALAGAAVFLFLVLCRRCLHGTDPGSRGGTPLPER